MSDFGTLYDYALQLEASVPAAAMAELEVIRPAVLGMTKRQKEEAEKLAAMSPEDRQKAEAEIAQKRTEALVKHQEAAAKRQEAADAQAQQQAQRSVAAQPAAAAPAPAGSKKD